MPTTSDCSTNMLNSSFNGVLDRCLRVFPCLADPVRRSSLVMRASLVILHLIYAGILFVFDGYLVKKARDDPLYVGLYLFLLAATVTQYFVTSCSSPGYVLDAMRSLNEKNVVFHSKQPASSKNGSLILTMDGSQSGRPPPGSNLTSWTKVVLDLYPPGTSIRSLICSYCSVEQPPRAKHCHDCDRCVLQFDHHCVWLGACIGQGNHCRFWWYICGETASCVWTGILYIMYLKADITLVWWKIAIMIILLITLSIALIFLLLLLIFHSYLILTNQTTYELVRRRRISYLRGVPERVYPFSKGLCRNLYEFCCIPSSKYTLERLPSATELEIKSRPYTCIDFLSCRCC